MGEVVCIEETIATSTIAFGEACSMEKEEIKEKGEDKCKEGNKCKLVCYSDLPDYMKDNEFILGYYRCEWPMKETLLSIFSIHNETLNVWSHLIGFFIFLCLTIFTAMVIPRIGGSISSKIQQNLDQLVEPNRREAQLGVIATILSPSHDEQLREIIQMQMQPQCSWPLIGTTEIPTTCRSSHVNNHTNACVQTTKTTPPAPGPEPITRWPLFAFLSGAMFCLLISTICHLISCHSEQTAYISLRLDYAGISALIVTSFYPLVYYSFLCDPFYRHLYMGFITIFGIATVLVSMVPVFQMPSFRHVRAALFSCMGVSGFVPVVHKLIWFHYRPEVVASTVFEAFMGMFYGLGVMIYATRVPERWFPGKFDLVGHSHQLFHLLVIAGAYTHYLAGLEYLKWRDVQQCW
ncbi:heptahelical transmembrane protein 4-like protein [Carex littledalei]|uniref:Heptahelical transmembrane protein 4-like protein n=1 Tax=Carex littledalei TaxID=544730 RepID=A0A833RLQ4_9POAL|nr:heptahelical transmembrane protein 4-like protein [Carex littledalei]